MRKSQPDRVVRVLTAVASVAYYGLWIAAVFLLVAVPVAKALNGPNVHYGLELPISVRNLETIQTVWGPVALKVDDARVNLELPVARLPWSLVAVLWTYIAVGFAVMLLFLQNLRRIFQRVRDGAPFDAQNAFRLRRLGVLLLVFAALQAVADVAAFIAVGRGLITTSSLAAPTRLHIDPTLIFAALVLIALAEVFRRGTDLEEEQSLVI